MSAGAAVAPVAVVSGENPRQPPARAAISKSGKTVLLCARRSVDSSIYAVRDPQRCSETAGLASARSAYSFRDQTDRPWRLTFMSIFRVRFVGSGFLE